MKKNVGKLDRLIRIALALLLALLVISNNLLGMWAFIAVVVGFVLFTTALYGNCPLYTLLNVSSNRK